MAKKSRKRATGAKRSARTAGGLASVSLSDLRAELQRRQRAAMPLLRRRERLVEQLTDIDGKLAAHGVALDENGASTVATARRKPGPKPGRARAASARGVTRPTRGGRGGNSMNLVEALQTVLANQQMAVKDLVDAVQQAGYKTKSPNFRTIVNQALTARPELFRKVSRGVYTVK